MQKLGHTWYPKDWWNSKTYYRLKKHPVVLRYAYREILDYLYTEKGQSTLDKEEIQDRFHIELSDQEFEILKAEFIIEDEIWTHESINSRLKKANSSRENGRLGGRPKKDNEGTNNEDEGFICEDGNPINATKEPKKPKKITHENPPYKLNKKETKIKEKVSVHTHDEILMFEKFQTWVKANTPSLNRMKVPLTIDEYLKLKNKFSPKVLTDVMHAMENKPTLVKNYKSTYRTINTWCNMRNDSPAAEIKTIPLKLENLKIND